MQIPDVAGYKLGEAKLKLQEMGVNIDSITVTSPPKLKLVEFDNSYRVIKVSIVGDSKVELVICKPL